VAEHFRDNPIMEQFPNVDGVIGLSRKCSATRRVAVEEQLTLERDTQRVLGQSADYREGVTAFLAKRPPRFTDR